MTDWVLYEHKKKPEIRYYVHPDDCLSKTGRYPHSVRIKCPRNVAFDTEDAPVYRMANGGVMPGRMFYRLYRRVK